MDFKKEFEGRTVFITGADGFIGSHLTNKLVEYGAKVHVLVRPISSGELHNIVDLREKITIHRADLADKHAIDEALSSLSKESKLIIFHLAAQAHVGESWKRLYETINSNILGTLNLLQSMKDLKLDLFKLVAAGTSEEYGNVIEEVRHHYEFKGNSLTLNERSPINPKSIYAISKVATDFLTRAYYDAYNMPGVVTRMFNNYGPLQNPRYVTGTIITQALSRHVIELGYLNAKRDFCYCEDGVTGYLHIALFGKPGDIYVYGQGENISVGDWCELILSIGDAEGYWQRGEKRIVTAEERGRLGRTEVEELRVDYSKLNKLTGWRPQYSWEEGIRKTIKWYAENKEKWIGRVDWR